MKLVSTLAAAVVLATAITGCSSKDKPSADPTVKVKAPHTSVGPVQAGSPSSSPHKVPKVKLTESGAPTTLDPCALVTQQEASSLAGVSFAAGKEGGNGLRKECIYGAQTPNVLSVYVVTAASEGDAQAGWNQLLSEAQQAAGQAAGQIQLSPESGVGDRAEWAELNLAQIDVQARGLAFQSGVTGVYIIDVVRGGAAPSRDALSNEAQTVLGRI
jgi:hypothetical protein